MVWQTLLTGLVDRYHSDKWERWGVRARDTDAANNGNLSHNSSAPQSPGPNHAETRPSIHSPPHSNPRIADPAEIATAVAGTEGETSKSESAQKRVGSPSLDIPEALPSWADLDPVINSSTGERDWRAAWERYHSNMVRPSPHKSIPIAMHSSRLS